MAEHSAIIYITNLIIGVIVATLMTQNWYTRGKVPAAWYWMSAAWVMTLADLLFLMQPLLPGWLARLAPTLLVTVGHAALWLGAEATAQQPRSGKIVLGLVLAHTLVLTYFLTLTNLSHWRMVTNGVVWAGLSFASYFSLRSAPVYYWKPLISPGVVCLLHGVVHLLRLTLAIGFAQYHWRAGTDWLHVGSDMMVSFYMVALFVALLMATLQQRFEELSQARAEVETLSGLMPICAWCKKVRDDQGYWQQVEEYLAQHRLMQFTHGICTDCLQKQMSK